MTIQYNSIDFHTFVDEELKNKQCRIIRITKELMQERIDEIANFVNSIRSEYRYEYGWELENREYFLNDLVDKWKYSFAIVNENNILYLINFSSIYNNLIHNHCTYTLQAKRSSDLAKLHMLKLCQSGLDNGFTILEGYFPKNNNGSIALHLKMGWEIQSIRNYKEVLLQANIEKVRNSTYDLIIHSKRCNYELSERRL